MTDHCSRASKGFKLQRCEARQAILYTIDRGAIPIYSVHLKCDSCRVNYHHDYYIHNNERHYCGGSSVPDVLQIGEHQFAETRLLRKWRLSCNQAWYGYLSLTCVILTPHRVS